MTPIQTHTYNGAGRARLASEDGQSLVLVLVLTATMVIMAAALATIITGSVSSSGRDTQEVRAIDLGQTGLNYGVSYMTQYLANNDSAGSLPVNSTVGTSAAPQYSGSVDGGTVKWWATKTASDTWTVYSSGTSATGVQRSESIQMKGVVTNTTQSSTISTPQNPIYGYGYAMADPNADCASVTPPANGGDLLGNSAAITVPVFIASSLCLSGGGSPLIAEPNASGPQSVSLYVGKIYKTTGNSSPSGRAAGQSPLRRSSAAARPTTRATKTSSAAPRASRPTGPARGSGRALMGRPRSTSRCRRSTRRTTARRA